MIKEYILVSIISIAVSIFILFSFGLINHQDPILLSKIQKDMNLEHWNIQLIEKELPEGVYAQVEPDPEYLTAKIYLQKGKELNKYALKHEMYHIHFSEIVHYLWNYTDLTDEQKGYVKYLEERMVENINRIN